GECVEGGGGGREESGEGGHMGDDAARIRRVSPARSAAHKELEAGELGVPNPRHHCRPSCGDCRRHARIAFGAETNGFPIPRRSLSSELVVRLPLREAQPERFRPAAKELSQIVHLVQPLSRATLTFPFPRLTRHSPDDSRTGMNSSVFLASLEASREVRAATRTTGGPNGIFPDDPQ